jgi:hypothetical protein
VDHLLLILQPKYGGKIIDIVSRDVQRPEDKAQALADVNGTILYIVVIVVTGYVSSKLDSEYCKGIFCNFLHYHLLFIQFVFGGSWYAEILIGTNN